MHLFNTIILSAGNSKRMGAHKALLNFNKETNFLQQIISIYYKLSNLNKIILVVNSDLLAKIQHSNFLLSYSNKLEIIVNNNPEKDRFHSILLACNSFKENRPTFIQNIDNPFITKEDIQKILVEYEKDSYISPTFNKKGLHPILLNSEIISEIKNKTNYNKSLKDFLIPYKKKYVEIKNKKLLYNINTPDDYQRFIKIEP